MNINIFEGLDKNWISTEIKPKLILQTFRQATITLKSSGLTMTVIGIIQNNAYYC